MSGTHKLRLKVQRRHWINPHTSESGQVITIAHGGVFVRLPIEQARQIVDRVHDLCDEHDREQREGSS